MLSNLRLGRNPVPLDPPRTSPPLPFLERLLVCLVFLSSLTLHRRQAWFPFTDLFVDLSTLGFSRQLFSEKYMKFDDVYVAELCEVQIYDTVTNYIDKRSLLS
jgi:hypothetical protein